MLKCWALEPQHCVLPGLLRKQKVFCFSAPLLSQQGSQCVHYGCRFGLVTTSQANRSTSSWVMKRYPNNSFAAHCLGWKQQKALLTCNQARDNERKNQHLQHTHQQLAGEREILDLAIGQLVGPEGEGQDNPCGSARDENGSVSV